MKKILNFALTAVAIAIFLLVAGCSPPKGATFSDGSKVFTAWGTSADDAKILSEAEAIKKIIDWKIATNTPLTRWDVVAISLLIKAGKYKKVDFDVDLNSIANDTPSQKPKRKRTETEKKMEQATSAAEKRAGK